jgi:hypothetical protein
MQVIFLYTYSFSLYKGIDATLHRPGIGKVEFPENLLMINID